MTKARDIASAIPAPSTVSSAELGYLDGVTSAIQTQVDAKIAKTLTSTTGDIIYASSANTPARLGIGSTDQILKVTGGVPAWATPAASSSGLTLIQRTSFSNVANTGTTFDSVFTSTYKAYQVVFEKLHAVTADNTAVLEFLYSGSVQSANYYGAAGKATYNSATFGNLQNSNVSQYTFSTHIGNSDYICSGVMWFNRVGNTSEKPLLNGLWFEPNDGGARFLGCWVDEARTYTGFRLRSNSTNVTGTVSVYGLAAS